MIDIEKILNTYTPEQLAVLKYRLETDYFDHAKFFLALREGQPFIIGRHHAIICNVMQKIIEGKIKRLIINIPPSYTKTELCVIQLASFGYAINPSCRFMHISGGDTLALDNSSKIKEQVLHPVSQKLWGTKVRDDAKSKNLWKTNKKGQFYAISAGSKKVMGFRAGRSKPGFQGAIIIDDPQAPEDFTPVKTSIFPEHYKSKIRTRTDNRDTPIIVVMQRLNQNDFSNFLLEGGSGEKWHHLCLPALIE